MAHNLVINVMRDVFQKFSWNFLACNSAKYQWSKRTCPFLRVFGGPTALNPVCGKFKVHAPVSSTRRACVTVFSACCPAAGWQKRLCKVKHWKREAHLSDTFNTHSPATGFHDTGEIPLVEAAVCHSCGWTLRLPWSNPTGRAEWSHFSVGFV